MLMIPGAMAMLMNSCIISGAVMAGISADITNIAYESGMPQAQAATISMYPAAGELIFRFVWSLATIQFHPTTCQIMYCIISIMSQVVLALATSYETFILGLILHSAVTAGYSLKTVVWIELVSLDNLKTIITVESVLCGINAVLIPMLAGFLSVRFDSTRILFHINVVLMILW